jgi:predicted GH43/DUF377 family glycosyl hydrolase
MKFFPFSILILILIPILFTTCSPEVQEANDTVATWELKGFEKADSINPILLPQETQVFTDPMTNSEVRWEERNVLNPAAVVKDDLIHLFYRAQDSSGTSRIGIAVSRDGLHFQKHPEPVFYPVKDSMSLYEWHYQKLENPDLPCDNCFDGVEDPRIIESEDGFYVMTYTAYDGKTARLSLAISEDLMHWEKKGLVLNTPELRDSWSKSGAIVVKRVGDKLLAIRIHGYYWMYYGDTDLFLAYSKDLIHWSPALNEESGKRISVLHPRPGYFDSRLVEPGPYALLTEQGILLIYNGSNAKNYHDPNLPVFTYAAGQALFDKNAPEKLIDRTDTFFLYPDKEYEKSGEVNLVCFVEGLVPYHSQWFLYYGTADSRIAVAVAPMAETN